MQVRMFATLRDLAGARQADIPVDGDNTVGDVLHRLAEQYPALGSKLWDDKGQWRGMITVLMNGRSVQYLSGFATPVGETDVIQLFPPVGGG